MSRPLVPDAFWAAAKPLLPPELPKPRGGGPRLHSRAALTGILFVLQSGIPWEMLPQEMHDSAMPEEVVDAVPPIQQPRGGPRQRPGKLHADKAYDHRLRRALTRRRIQLRIARRGIESSAKLGHYPWVVERTLAWVSQSRRLAIRYERRADVHTAFLALAPQPSSLGASSNGDPVRPSQPTDRIR